MLVHFEIWIDLLPMQDFVTNIGHLEDTGLLSYVDVPKVHRFFTSYEKITFVSITTDLTRQVLKYWETFSKFYFLIEYWIFAWAKHAKETLHVSFKAIGSFCSFLRKRQPNIQTIVYLSVVLPNKNGIP